MPDPLSIPKIRRRRYAIVGGQRPLTGADIEADFREFDAPVSQLLLSHVIGPGVVIGLVVTGNTGENVIRVSCGVAVDAAGRLIVLSSPHGLGRIGEEPDGQGGLKPSDNPVTVPVELSLSDRADQILIVTIEHYEGIVDDGTLFDMVELQPWIRLRSVESVTGNSVVLAVVRVDGNGKLLELRTGDGEFVRKSAGHHVGEIEVYRTTRSQNAIENVRVGAVASSGADLSLRSESGITQVDGHLRVSSDINCSGTINGKLAAKSVSRGMLEAELQQSIARLESLLSETLDANKELRKVNSWYQHALRIQNYRIIKDDGLYLVERERQVFMSEFLGKLQLLPPENPENVKAILRYRAHLQSFLTMTGGPVEATVNLSGTIVDDTIQLVGERPAMNGRGVDKYEFSLNTSLLGTWTVHGQRRTIVEFP